MSTTIDELRVNLERAGWCFGPALKDTGVSWYAWQRLDGVADCTCNDKPPSLILSPYEVAINGEIHGSVEFEVCGEVHGGRWVNLKTYSVPMTEAMQSIQECTRILSAAWNAAATPLPAEQPSNPVARIDEAKAQNVRWRSEHENRVAARIVGQQTNSKG